MFDFIRVFHASGNRNTFLPSVNDAAYIVSLLSKIINQRKTKEGTVPHYDVSADKLTRINQTST